MQTVWALVGLLSLVVAACSFPLVLLQRLRRKAGLTLCLSLIVAATGIAQFGKLAPSSNTAQPTDKLSAPIAPTPATEERSLPSVQAAEPPPALDPVKPRKAGVARICLLDDDVKLKPADAIELPATTVLRDRGSNTGRAEDPKTWHYEVNEGPTFRSAIVTLASVTLKRSAPCATTPVKMYLGPIAEAAAQAVSDHRVFTIDDVIDYPIPPKKPPVEIGKLIDDDSIKAMLVEDVSDTFTTPLVERLGGDRTRCLSAAKKVAAHVGGGTGRQTDSIVMLGGVPAQEASFGCSFGTRREPNLYVSWDGSAKPPPATLAFIGKASEFLIGAPVAEMIKETQACASAALKPDASETAEREFRGAKVECHVFARDGGGGSVTVYRRFGAYPERSDPRPEAASAADAASRLVAAKEVESRADAVAFAEWWRDPAVPKDVKMFSMMSSRIIALEERCPSSKKHTIKLAAWALSAGVKPEDIGPSGRYNRLMAGTLSAMREDTQKESVQAACEALRKYD
ncbi:hypothetical protein [Methylobacterium sp.]|uniref:hypothetical protein n=1 Tax=Methylobacterium sp. TaxID=409 RepID=UPI003B0042A7